MTPSTHRSPDTVVIPRTRRAQRTAIDRAVVDRRGSAEPVSGLTKTVHLLSEDPQLIEAVEAVCVSCRVELAAVENLGDAKDAQTLLIDATAEVAHAPKGAMIVALSSHTAAWELAARSAASAVVVLPDAAEWLAEMLSSDDHDANAVDLGRVIGVVGAAGGVGASTFACWLAQELSGTGAPTAVVDADPGAAGLDLVLGTESEEGLRWPELQQFSGAVAADQLWAAMPSTGPLRYLSWDRHGTHATRVPVSTVIHALRRAASYLVVDLTADCLEEQARWCSTVLVLTPRTVRGVLAATLAVQRCGDIPAMTVLTGLNVADVDTALVESACGVGCAGSLSFDPRLPQELDNGAALQRGRRSKHAKAVRAIAQRLEAGS
ncbi:septum site-determining protein Ssd [Kocuria sp. cx-455]|uniref:septum site-determining protein Ssd n=1 Tax=Kocuria sp. cx-455 TaxID=2771377 RepID=UPI003D76435D